MKNPDDPEFSIVVLMSEVPPFWTKNKLRILLKTREDTSTLVTRTSAITAKQKSSEKAPGEGSDTDRQVEVCEDSTVHGK